MPFFCLLDLTKVLYKLHDPEKTSETVRKREDKKLPVVFWSLLPSLHATCNCILVCYCLGFWCQWAGIYLPYSCATICKTVEEDGKDHGCYLHSFGSLHEKSPLLHCIEWNRKLQTWVMKHQVWETMGKKLIYPHLLATLLMRLMMQKLPGICVYFFKDHTITALLMA